MKIPDVGVTMICEQLGAAVPDTRDAMGGERFNVFPPHVCAKGAYHDWYREYKAQAEQEALGGEGCSATGERACSSTTSGPASRASSAARWGCPPSLCPPGPGPARHCSTAGASRPGPTPRRTGCSSSSTPGTCLGRPRRGGRWRRVGGPPRRGARGSPSTRWAPCGSPARCGGEAKVSEEEEVPMPLPFARFPLFGPPRRPSSPPLHSLRHPGQNAPQERSGE
ncbi:unnamed protein product [Prorocentrum cordatum]|uniref:Uncharacterized protein n=1 Tax=Prorocentrum cordatum TaxID=2364126 RepID=A0ABN9W586_9DINO|nr:unnamed protein product [Polarella glacialis]